MPSHPTTSKTPPPEPAGDLAMTTMQLSRAVRGDADSLEWIVRRLTPLLRAQASYRMGRVLRQSYDPDDLVHDAWLAALPRLRELLGDHERRRTPVLLRYLCQTIVYRIGQLARRHVRRRAGAAIQPSAVSAAISGAVTRAFRREVTEEVQRQLDALEERDREVVLLRGIEQRTAAETAVVLGIGVDAVHKRYQRAIAKLRARLPSSVFDELGD